MAARPAAFFLSVILNHGLELSCKGLFVRPLLPNTLRRSEKLAWEMFEKVRRFDEVCEVAGDSGWIPMQRFEVVQKNKVRGVDSATSNRINMATVVKEMLELMRTWLLSSGFDRGRLIRLFRVGLG